MKSSQKCGSNKNNSLRHSHNVCIFGSSSSRRRVEQAGRQVAPLLPHYLPEEQGGGGVDNCAVTAGNDFFAMIITTAKGLRSDRVAERVRERGGV